LILTQYYPNYTCCIKNKNIDGHQDYKYSGQHRYGKSNNDVRHIQFTDCNLTKIPSNLNEIFPNLKAIHIENSKMKKISSDDLSKYQHLQAFVSIKNGIEYLPGDLFEDFENLEKIVFIENWFEFIDPSILNGLDKLKFITLFDNKNYKLNNESIIIKKHSQKNSQYLHDIVCKNFHYSEELKKTINRLELKHMDLRVYLDKCLTNSYWQTGDLISEKAEIKKENEQLQSSKAVLNQQVKYLKDTETALILQIMQLNLTNGNLKEENEEQKATEHQFNQQIQQLSSANRNLENENEELKQSNKNIQHQIQNLKSTEENLRRAQKNSKKEVEKMKIDKVKINQELQSLKESQSKLVKQIQQLQNFEKNLKDECHRLKISNGEFQESQQQSKILQADLSNQVQQLKNNNQNLKKENQDLKKIKSNLEEENQSMKKFQSGLSTELTSFIHDENTKDFRIKIDDREFPVHKFLLAARSPTLAEILKNNPEVENLNLVDISVEIFEIILKFLYTDELPVEDETNFLHLFAAAGKLKITKLVKYASTKIFELIDAENALEILRLSVTFGLDDLKQKAFQEVKKKYKNINFKDELINNPEKLVKIIAMFKKKEDALKKFDDEFKELMTI